MRKTAVNPWTWSLKYGFNQGEILEGVTRELVCAGQTAVDADGNPQHPNDMRAQITLAFENLEAVLASAGMSPANLKRLTIYATDMDAALQNLDVLGAKLGRFGASPPMTMLGVSRLALPPLMIEIEATAVA